MKKLIALLCSLALATAVFAGGRFAEISHDELLAAVANNTVTVIDVNGSKSFVKGRIPGSVDFAANKDQLASLLPADKHALIVAYCGNERCNAYRNAAIAAEKLGYTNIKHYSPGLAGWKKSGAPMDKS
jgi:rhodanese-related sulfurtransferase